MGIDAKITAFAFIAALIYVITKIRLERLEEQQKFGKSSIPSLSLIKKNITREWRIFKRTFLNK